MQLAQSFCFVPSFRACRSRVVAVEACTVQYACSWHACSTSLSMGSLHPTHTSTSDACAERGRAHSRHRGEHFHWPCALLSQTTALPWSIHPPDPCLAGWRHDKLISPLVSFCTPFELSLISKRTSDSMPKKTLNDSPTPMLSPTELETEARPALR